MKMLKCLYKTLKALRKLGRVEIASDFGTRLANAETSKEVGAGKVVKDDFKKAQAKVEVKIDGDSWQKILRKYNPKTAIAGATAFRSMLMGESSVNNIGKLIFRDQFDKH